MLELSLTFAFSAFLGGIIMFLAPCTLPLVPAFLASLAPESKASHHEREVLIRTVIFSLGFSIVFVLLGILSGFLGAALALYKQVLTQVGAVLIIVFGLSLLGVFQIPILKSSFQRLRVPKMEKGRFVRPFLFGVVFALGWSPCAGPLLASILLLASQTGTVVQGGLLLALFSLGLALPFMLTGMLYAHAVGFFNLYEKYYRHISMVSGAFLVLLGGGLLFGMSLLLSDFGFMLYDILGIAPICTYY
jgi:cytochrome c-type biogenesis protein